MSTVESHSKLPPGPRIPRPLQMLGWVARPAPFMERCHERYGDIFVMRIRGGRGSVLLSNPDDIKRVLTAGPELVQAGETNAMLTPVVGTSSVMVLEGQRHLAQRKLMLPPFHGERMRHYGQLVVEIARRDIAEWPVGEPFSLLPRMSEITLSVIMRAIFGITDAARLDHVRKVMRGLTEWALKSRRLALLMLLDPERLKRHRGFRAVMDPIDAALLEEIRRCRDAPDLDEREDVLSLLVRARYDDGSAMGEEELRDELITLLFAGHDTTAISLAWAFERLLRHPDKLERMRAEALKLKRDGSEPEEAAEQYADAVVKETLRLRPVLPGVLRKLREPMELGGYTIPAGMEVVPCSYLLHHREDIYPNPRAFQPERFLERPAGTYTWIPFGGGVRRCLGASFALLQMKRVLQTVLCEVRLRAAEPRSERIVKRAVALNPEHGTRVVVIERTPTSGPEVVREPVFEGADA